MKNSNSRLLVSIIVAALLFTSLYLAFPLATQASARPVDSPQVTTPAWFNCTYVVRPGDDLYRIALRYGISYWTLASANGIWNPNWLWVGMVLRVPCPFFPPPPVPPPPSNVCAVYFVRPGDWLLNIAARFGVSWQSIAAANHLANPNWIFVGMRLVIPCGGGSPYTAPVVFATPLPDFGVIPVDLQGIAYHPASINIHQGQRVLWRNFDTGVHTITQGTCAAGICTATPGGFDGSLQPDQHSFKAGENFNLTFNNTGSFPYFCKIHGAAMKGTVNVFP